MGLVAVPAGAPPQRSPPMVAGEPELRQMGVPRSAPALWSLPCAPRGRGIVAVGKRRPEHLGSLRGAHGGTRWQVVGAGEGLSASERDPKSGSPVGSYLPLPHLEKDAFCSWGPSALPSRHQMERPHLAF